VVLSAYRHHYSTSRSPRCLKQLTAVTTRWCEPLRILLSGVSLLVFSMGGKNVRSGMQTLRLAPGFTSGLRNSRLAVLQMPHDERGQARGHRERSFVKQRNRFQIRTSSVLCGESSAINKDHSYSLHRMGLIGSWAGGWPNAA
jgi:hypothetical protein